ncbi:HAD family hydrolase [Janthinobacterium agaricidamnosum]|uniref:HAD-superhydrolase, subIA, variant 1 family protein n=1 Tax=Janthinobacterium agaricidamnosum NBRC 102515 = DSM 9628 TaxID=1349767 RepID=W0UX27_9BURK|nr:HAD family hydrolase [Janthinobacterium agaricidamnosum]CDG81054.1 HAD-superhydrolase, subIA, variant 1 family protein [Janthinobacterium agaricidamnosum NBRC 102515 = DSM 9628]
MTHVRPKAILFDLDDTLWPIGPVIERAETLLHDWLTLHAPRVAQQFSIRELRRRRLALLAEQPHFHIDLGALRRAGLLEVFALAGEDVAKVDAAMALFMAARNVVTPYGDVLPGLQRLKDQLLLGSISNGVADLEVIGMAHHFKVSLAACDFGRAKPDAAIFLAACAALGVAPHEAIYVGDDLRLDVAGAQNAGMRAVWMNRAGSDAHLAAGIVPDAMCASFDELIAWLAVELQD